MLILKIKWVRFDDNGEVADETAIFSEGERIQSHGIVKHPDEMKAWEEGSFLNYQIELSSGPKDADGKSAYKDARLIEVVRENKPPVWYLASMAWIMSPEGKTIERLI